MQRTCAKMASAAARDEIRHYEVLVLGAGMSGLACASRLYQHQHYKAKNRLLVLEARDRIGGRIQSVHVNGCRLDTGANWIHGIGTADQPNPLMTVLPHKRLKKLGGVVAFAAQECTESRPGQASSDWVEVKSLGSPKESKGRDLVIPASASGPIMAALWDTIESLHEMAAAKSADEVRDTTMLKAITKAHGFKQAFKDIPKEYHASLSAMPQFIEVMEAGPLAAQSAEQAKGSVGMGLLEFAIDDFDGDQVFLQDGYTAVIEEVAKDLVAADLIQLSAEVQQVDWSEKPIRVKTSQGTYTADEVVCTLPLGVLQHHTPAQYSDSTSTLFQPVLPTDKSESIQRLGFGTLDKIMLVYDKPWWTEEPYTSIFKHAVVDRPLEMGTEEDVGLVEREQTSPDSFMGFTEELPGIAIKEDGSNSTGSRLLSLVNLQTLTDQPALSCFVSCSNAVQVEAMTDDQAGALVHRALTQWLVREVPTPSAVHVSRWASDEYSRGSYSHMIKGLSETRHREAFQKPIRGAEGATLRFAGEHTSPNHFATVHGALISGWREADDILKHLEPS